MSARKAWADVPPEVLNREYSFEDAMGVIKQFAAARFDESVDIVVKLGIDTKRPDQHVRGVSYLPHNPGKPMRVAVFAEQDWHERATGAGAHLCGDEELMAQISSGDVPIDFNHCIATPTMAALLGQKLGRQLGPKKLMPNAKVGTVTNDIMGALARAKQGQAKFRSDKGANVHAGIGRVSMEGGALAENARAFLDSLVDARQDAPKKRKGVKKLNARYVEKVMLGSTHGKALTIGRHHLSAYQKRREKE